MADGRRGEVRPFTVTRVREGVRLRPQDIRQEDGGGEEVRERTQEAHGNGVDGEVSIEVSDSRRVGSGAQAEHGVSEFRGDWRFDDGEEAVEEVRKREVREEGVQERKESEVSHGGGSVVHSDIRGGLVQSLDD